MWATPFFRLRRGLHERFVRWALRVPTPEPAPIILTQRRVYVLPTRPGLAFAVALITIFLGAVNYNLSLGHALVFLLAGLGVVTILHTFRNLVQLRIRPGRCEPVFAGGHASFTVLLENIRSDTRISLRLYFARSPPLSKSTPPRTAATAATLTLPAPHRGWLALPRITLETTWPVRAGARLELCRARHALPGLSATGGQGATAALGRRHRTRQPSRRPRRG